MQNEMDYENGFSNAVIGRKAETGLRQVTVNREKLIAQLEQNLSDHNVKFGEAIVGHKKRLQSSYLALADRLISRGGAFEQSVKATLAVLGQETNDDFEKLRELHAEAPESHASDYTDAIAMLKWCEDKTVTLSANEFHRFVLDKWEWRARADALYLANSAPRR